MAPNTSPAPLTDLKIKYTKILINNQWHDSVSGKKFPVYNPATEEKICDIEEGDKSAVNIFIHAFKEDSICHCKGVQSRAMYKQKDTVFLGYDKKLVKTEVAESGLLENNSCKSCKSTIPPSRWLKQTRWFPKGCRVVAERHE